MVVERGECSMFDTHTFSRISFPVIMARTNGKSFFVSFNRFGEEYNLLMGDNPIYTDTNGDKIPVVILQIMLLDERPRSHWLSEEKKMVSSAVYILVPVTITIRQQSYIQIWDF